MICAREKVNSNDAVVRIYSWGPEAQGAPGTLRMIADNNGVYFPAYDPNGNVMGLVKASDGTVCAQYEYGPYGEEISATGVLEEKYSSGGELTGYSGVYEENPIRFSTKYYDAEARLYYYGYRYYSPDMGRWISRDPIEEQGGLNLYAFCGNDPVNFVDPSGLFVVMILDKKNNTLRVSDAGRKITVQAFTGGHLADDGTIILQGGEGENPIPNGMYWIVENPNPKGYSGWYGVVKVDNRIDDYFYEGEKERSGIRLHLGKVSHGCVTVSNKQPNANEKWNEICEALDNTETDLIDFRVPHRPCSKKLIRYGSILVK